MPDSDIVDNIKKRTDIDGAAKKQVMEYFDRVSAKEIFLNGEVDKYRIPGVANLVISRCFSCKALSVWHADSILYPAHRFEVEPNDDMPPDVKADFFEAAAIVEASPRGAAALLRLAIQKLMPHVGQTGKDLNKDIGVLVSYLLEKHYRFLRMLYYLQAHHVGLLGYLL